jgi:tetratricopeptide (TPR) repeat protein
MVSLGAVPVLAQNGSNAAQLEELKSAYANFQQAAKQGNHNAAYTHLSDAIRLADEVGQSGALSKLQNFQQRLPTKWGNEALNAESYSQALTHFEKGIEWSPQDAYVHYGKGLALVNMDSTEAGLEAMREAIQVGEETGNTRVTEIATERIRDEFVSQASQTLSKQNPSTSDANTALEALDQMREYVDPSASSLFYRASALFAKGEHDQAIATAREGLSMHQGSRSDAAKYHFIIGESQFQSGNQSAACQTFQQAAYGDYKARAEHYLENECQ